MQKIKQSDIIAALEKITAVASEGDAAISKRFDGEENKVLTALIHEETKKIKEKIKPLVKEAANNVADQINTILVPKYGVKLTPKSQVRSLNITRQLEDAVESTLATMLEFPKDASLWGHFELVNDPSAEWKKLIKNWPVK